MKWGTFSPLHFFTLFLAAAMLFALYFGLKGRSTKVQTAVLLPFSLLGVGAIVYNLLTWGEPLAYLPLHLCSINAILLPIVVLTRNKTLGNLLLVWCLGALAALILNYEMTEADIFGLPFVAYYFPHVFEFGVPLILIKLGLVKKDCRCILSTLMITMEIYTFVHFCNCLLNKFTDVRVNYMFSITPSNPLLAVFYKIVPYAYWYMYMILPIVAGYLLVVYAPQLRGQYRQYRVRRSRKKFAV